jgi:hypothetical protein
MRRTRGYESPPDSVRWAQGRDRGPASRFRKARSGPGDRSRGDGPTRRAFRISPAPAWPGFEKLYSDRRRRDDYFPGGLFGEPAWDLLLALFIALEDGRDLDLPKAYEAARVDPDDGPALVDKLVAAGMVVRSRGRYDKRRNTVVLTDQAVERLSNYLVDVI